MIKDILQELGFNEKQTRVYLVCLELGSASATEISRKSGIVRTSVYKILNELITENLIEVDIKSKIKTFIALHPARMIDLLENKRRKAQNCLPELLNIFNQTKFKPKVKFSEGKTGIKKVFEDILNFPNETIYTFSPISSVLSRFGATYTRHFTAKRIQNNISRKALRSAKDKSKKIKNWEFYASDKTLLREVRFLSPEINLKTLIQIYENRVSIISFEKENFAFIIESQELSSFMKQIFRLLWSISKEE